MAIVQYYSLAQMNSLWAYDKYDEILSVSSKEIRIESNLWMNGVDVFSGTGLAGGIAGVTAGSISRYDSFFADGVTRTLTITGLEASAVKVFDYLADDGVKSVSEFQSYLLRGADEIRGSSADDTISGYGGNDTLNGLAGKDIMAGGDGSDTYYVDQPTDVVMEKNPDASVGGVDTVYTYFSNYVLPANIENGVMLGGAILTGNGLNNRLTGRTDGEMLDGGEGNDTLIGGDGSDTYLVRDTGDRVKESNASGKDTVLSYLGAYTLPANVETGRINVGGAANLAGNELANTLFAGAGNNRLDGDAGDDWVDYSQAASGVKVSLATTGAQSTGGSGSDTLIGIERLRGSSHSDRLTGNDTANTLSGGYGNDTLAGGGGADRFRFDVTPDAGNIDRIVDFSLLDDKIQLENMAFLKLATTGVLAANNFRVGVDVHALDSDDYIVYDTQSGRLYYDSDGSGSGAALHVVTLSGAPALTAADIFVT